MFKLIYFLILLGVALFGAAFASINADKVPIDYYFGIIELPMGVLMLAMVGMGIIVGAMACTSMLIRLKRENSSLRRKASVTDQEVRNLRTIPVKDR